MKNVIFIILTGILFFACKKEQVFHITATNIATGERIPNLTYSVVESTAGSFGEKSKIIREGVLDANGEANFSIKVRNKKHVIRVSEPENNCYVENLSLTFGSENFNADFKFAPCAYRKHTITNINCQNANDKIEISISRFVDNNYESPWIILGCDGYVPTHFTEVPMGTYYYKWIVTKNGVSNTFLDTTYLDENSYTNYEINY